MGSEAQLSFGRRILLAGNVLRGTVPRSVYPRTEGKSAPYLWPAWKGGQPAWHMVNIEAYLKEGFTQNSLVYSSVSYKARQVALAPMRAYEGEPDKPRLTSLKHPLSTLLMRPNEYMSQMEL